MENAQQKITGIHSYIQSLVPKNLYAYEHVGMCVMYVYVLMFMIHVYIVIQSNVLCIDGIGSYGQASFILLHEVVSYPHLH